MGAGKTKTAIALLDADNAQRVLVAAPKSVVHVWARELAEHSSRDWIVWDGLVPGARGPLRNPTVAQRAGALGAMEKQAAHLGRPFMAVTNYEAVWTGPMASLTLGADWDALIGDEFHRTKSPGGKASRHLARIAQRVRDRGGRVLALTGTPMPHSPADLYAQYRALDPTIFGTSAAAFRARYLQKRVKYVDQRSGEPVFLTGPRGEPVYSPELRPDRADEFAQLAGRIMHRVSADTLDKLVGLEAAVESYRTVDLEPATRRVYEDLEREMISMVGEGVITAANAMVNVLRLSQAAGGFGRDANSGATIAITEPPEKARLLADVLEDLDDREPVVVFARFHHDLDRIEKVARTLGRRYGELSGRRRDGLSGEARMADGVEILGAQLRSGGVGIDLTRARYGIYYSLSWELADLDQSRARLRRPGQQRRVTFVHLLARDTIEETQFHALRARRNVIASVLARLGGTA